MQPAMTAPDTASAASLPEAPPRTWRGRLALAAKLAVTVGVLGVLAVRADWSGVAARIADISPGWLAVGVALKAAGILFAGERWRWAAASCGAVINSWTALRLMLAGLFLGQMLPGALGGDVARGWLTYRAGCPAASVVTAMILDRLLALVGVVVIMFVGLPHLVAASPPSVAWAPPLATLALAVGVAVGLQIDRVPLPRFLRRPPIAALLDQVGRLRRALFTRAALVSGLHAAGVHITTIAAVVAFARALDLPVSPMDALAVVPVAIFAAALPISLNGWGVREGAMAAGLALFGIGSAEAVVLSLLIVLSVTVLTLPGGLLWLTLKAEAPQR